MGTSAAVNYSYIYVRLLEMQSLLVDFKKYLLFYRRFIDDGIGIWDCSLPDSEAKFQEFLARLNDWGKLKWTTTGFVDSLIFMDLTVTIKHDSLHFKTFQKEHNLYLYIPPSSAHSPDMVRGLIFGRLRTYYKHNSDTNDYHNMAILLAERLMRRGWNWLTLCPIFRDAHYRNTGKHIKVNKPTSTMRPIFIHSTYHPRGIQRQDLRRIFMETLGQEIPNPLIVAVSRPKNLRDRLCCSKLPYVEGCNPSDFINEVAGAINQAP